MYDVYIYRVDRAPLYIYILALSWWYKIAEKAIFTYLNANFYTY